MKTSRTLAFSLRSVAWCSALCASAGQVSSLVPMVMIPVLGPAARPFGGELRRERAARRTR
jgi:hypothetical protein